LPFLVTQDPQSGKGREYGEKMENKKITLAMILRLYKPSVIARNGLFQYLARWGKINKLKCFLSLL
jgi:hypothetical protein